MKPAIVLWLVVVLTGCSGLAPEPQVSDYKFVVLGPEGVPVARAITAALRCPDIVLDGVVRAMTVRMPAATIPLRPTRSAPAQSKPSAFPVLTCEAVIPAGTQRATIAGDALPLPKVNPQRIVVIGDTGCRILYGATGAQSCDDPAHWPFARVANTAAAVSPDLVIHVGDYHYRENACPAGVAGCAGSPWGFGWDAWRADFFEPARTLLAAAPWVVIRGNHESCARAGQGWWRFLDPRPVASRQDCNAAVDDDIGDYSEPYVVPLHAAAGTEFIVFDSSLVGVTPLQPATLMYRNYHAQLTAAFARTAKTPRIFFINHHPVLGFAANPSNPQSPFPGNAGLQSVLQNLYPAVLFPPNVEALLSGHNHVFQMVSFLTAQPPQFLSGNSGDWVDQPFPTPFPPNAQPAPGAAVQEIVASNRFGFMSMDRVGTGWVITAWDLDGAPLTTCTLGERHATCAPIAEPWVRR
ncbi:MAG: metallophosphoesterase [Betaproteobacteria bacterium]